MPLDLKDTPEQSKEPRRFRLNLSPAGLVGAIGLLLVGLAWVFIIGVLVGRGYKPEQAVPELARMMPGANATADDKAAGAKVDTSVLRPEDLQVYDDLGKKPAASKAAPATKPKAAASESAPSPSPRTTAKTEPVPKPSAKAEPAPTPEPTAAAAPSASTQDDDSDQAVYDYRYQAASVRDRASALAFQKRLAALGLESNLESAEVKGAQWLRVIVHFRGRPLDTRDLKAKLATLGVDKPIMRSKEPAGQ